MQKPGPDERTPMETIQIGRQAIFDRDLEVFAYELLYRNAGGNSAFVDGDQASSTTLLNAFMEIGLERIIGPHKAFVNLTRHFFVDMPEIPFPPERVVLEILEDVEVDNALLDGVAKLAAEGYEIALDDYAFQPQFAPILPLVRYVKVEINQETLAGLDRHMPRLRACGARLLAEKVETSQQFHALKDIGFDLFQGYFFARPDLIRSDRLHENSALVMRLLARLNDPSMPMNEVVYLVSQDAGLSFKILRYINSAATGLRVKVDSIQRAVVMMGLQRIRAWASLFALAGLAGRPAELLNLGLLRANLCERLARQCDRGAADTAYTVGLLSILGAMMGCSDADLMHDLPLPDEIRDAIVRRDGPYGGLLAAAMQIERGEWPDHGCNGLEPTQVAELYAESSAAAFATMELLDDAG